jgi:hypothetical protein
MSGQDIEFQYLGDNQEAGQSLYNETGSQYKGPVLNLTKGMTKGLSTVNRDGVVQGSADPAPIRIHSTTRVADNQQVNLASGGCFMFSLGSLETMQTTLDDWGVKPGDTFSGYIIQLYR